MPFFVFLLLLARFKPEIRYNLILGLTTSVLLSSIASCCWRSENAPDYARLHPGSWIRYSIQGANRLGIGTMNYSWNNSSFRVYIGRGPGDLPARTAIILEKGESRITDES